MGTSWHTTDPGLIDLTSKGQHHKIQLLFKATSGAGIGLSTTLFPPTASLNCCWTFTAGSNLEISHKFSGQQKQHHCGRSPGSGETNGMSSPVHGELIKKKTPGIKCPPVALFFASRFFFFLVHVSGNSIPILVIWYSISFAGK